MRFSRILCCLTLSGLGFVGGSLDLSHSGGMIRLQQASAHTDQGVARRTARRTARRNSGGSSVVAIGTVVVRLPSNCKTLVVNGLRYRNCSGTYYRPKGTQWIVVKAP